MTQKAEPLCKHHKLASALVCDDSVLLSLQEFGYDNRPMEFVSF